MKAELRVIKSVFCKDFETFFSRKRTRSVTVKTSLPPFNPSAGCRVSACDPVPSTRSLERTRTWTRTWTRSLDKFYHVFSSFGQGTWTRNLQPLADVHWLCKRKTRGSLSKFLSKFGSRGWLGKNGPTSHTVVREEKLARSTQTKQNHAKSCHIKNRAKTG